MQQIQPFAKGSRLKSVILILTALLILLFFANLAADAVRIFFGACILSFILLPAVRFLERKMKPSIAALSALIAVFLGILLIIILILPLLVRQFSAFIELLPEAFDRLKQAASGITEWFGRRFPNMKLPQFNLTAVEDGFTSIAKTTINYVGSIAGKIYTLALTAVLSCFLLSGREKSLLRAELLIPGVWRKTVVRMGNAILRELRLYLRGQAGIAFAVAVLASAGLMILGIPGGLFLGILVGIFNVIPYLGPVIGGFPAVIMALSISWRKALLSIAVLFVVQQIDSLVISPRIMGSITGFSPAVILIALYLASRAGGVWGLLLAMPLMMCIRTVYRVFVQRYEND